VSLAGPEPGVDASSIPTARRGDSVVAGKDCFGGVEIVNMPSEVYSFGPVYVLVTIENTGSTPVYLSC
jgi:hypothetical protein